MAEVLLLADLNGLPLTCRSAEAVELYNEVLVLYSSLEKPFMDQLKKALELDPEFVLARCMMASFLSSTHCVCLFVIIIIICR